MLKECKKLVIDRLPKRFNEGLFWGNGHIGGFLYVVNNSLRFSVDNVKLWETRDNTEDCPSGTFQEFINKPEKFHDGTLTMQKETAPVKIWRTHLPGLRLNITLEDEIVDFYGEIDFDKASSEILVTLKNGKQVKGFIYVDSNVNILKVELDTKDSLVEINGWDTSDKELSILARWNYKEYKVEEDTTKKNNKIIHVLQPFSENGLAVISLNKNENQIYIALNAELLSHEESILNSKDYIFNSKTKHKLVNKNSALLMDYMEKEDDYKKAHDDSWKEFWNRFNVKIPNNRLQHAFYLEMYKVYANERKDSWPVTLQGIWNNDARMPAWYGDWHNDLNVQACYWPSYKTNNVELVDSYIDYYTKSMPRLTERAYKLFGIKNAIHCPVMMGPDGYAVGGEWCFWNVLLGPEVFVAVDFCWYYEYSKNVDKLESSIYPFIERVLNLYMGIAYKKEDGYLHIPFSNSPEVFKDGKMFIKDDATVIISSLHYLLKHMEGYAKILGKDRKRFSDFNNKLTPVKITEKGYPLFPNEDVFESHRHFCHLFPLFPLGTDTHSKTAEKSLNTIVDNGFMEYASWSFPYLSIFASRVGRGNMARMMLEIYCMAFRTINTFVVNGDMNQNGILRISDTNAGESSDAFTLEAGFMVAAAISEMFVHRSNDTIYVAYGIPDEWKECSCKNMTIEGGHKISVEIKKYKVKQVKLEAGHNESLSISFAKLQGVVKLNGDVLLKSDEYTFNVEKGKEYIFEM